MKEFQLTRYLRRWWWVIAVLSFLSGVVFYLVISSRQTYKAQTMIEFTNNGAADGLYPSGDKIDVEEIKSSAVIWNALESVNRTDSVDIIRRRISISAVISDQDSSIQVAKWNKGEEYEFFPVQYIISYESGRSENASDARRMLEAIVDNYVNSFSSKYLVIPEVPNSVESLRNLNYDYIEWAEVLDDFINTDRNYLYTMKSEDSMFRSSQTGYSFQDLYNEYNLIHTVYLPSLYSLILENHITKDPKLLISRYQYREDQNNLAIKNYEEALAVVESMLDAYSEKNQETINFLWGTGESSEGDSSTKGPGSTNVLDMVYKPENISDLNTYDSVLNRYIKLRSDLEQKVSDNEYCHYVVSAFLENGEEGMGEANAEDVMQINSIVAFIEARLRILDEIMSISTSEYIKKEAMKNIKVLSTVNVTATVNIKLYTALIVVVFFIFGVTVAVVVGRGLDFVEYHFYTDTVTDLPNRMSCDNEISKLEKKPLPIPFTCVVIALTNIKEINDVVGRDGGNEVLRVFASHIKSCSEDFGFLGYNGSLNFMGLFSVCDQSRALYFKNLLLRDIAEFNRGDHGVVIKYKIACSTATADKPHTIRELVSMAMSQMRIEKEVVADKVFTGPGGV